MHACFDVKAPIAHLLAKIARVFHQAIAQFTGLCDQIQHFNAGVGDRGCKGIGKQVGRDRCRSNATMARCPDVKPPDAPPNALPRVLVMISTRPITLQCSAVPRPVAPNTPVAWLSSTITNAS